MSDLRLMPGEAASAFGVVQAGEALGLVSGAGLDPLTAAAALDAAAWVTETEAELLCVPTEETHSGDAGTAMVGSFVATEAANTEALTTVPI